MIGLSLDEPHDVARLRDLTSRSGGAVDWTGSTSGGFDPAALHHLPPPAELRGDVSAGLEAWRAAYLYGTFYYRVGPGFLTVTDSRDPDHPRRMLLDGPEVVAAFRRCLEPVRLAALPAAEAATVEGLASDGLVLVTAGVAVTLPYRMVVWPVPLHAV